ncbi:hypothetical protein LQM76_003710 [Escherichia coli]|nr:hypothetical protein [Escherichia coli]EIO4791150.1 hypothetical protein [Escherichia coli]
MLKFIQNNREITALLAVVLLFVLPGFLDRQYLSVQTLTMVYSSAQILILLAMGATLVMLTRNIDVSVGSITGMCAVLLGMLLNAGYSLPVACVATLLLGLLAGFFNGALVAWLKIPAIVATLGTFGSARSDLGASFLMPAITAVVLGGANIYGGSGSIIGTAIAVLLVGYLQQGLQMAGVPNQVSSALSGALLIVVVVGRSVSLHRQQIKEWLARRANNPLP